MPQFDRTAAVARYGPVLRAQQEQIRDAFIANQADARETSDALTILMDETLQSIWHDIAANLGVDLADHLALLAVGGYGRGQLAPHSDIDLLFLRVSGDHALQDQAVEDMLYVLWDLSLKVGQAIRTPQECLTLGASDPIILTSLLDTRLIRGSRKGFVSLRKAIDERLLAPNRRSFVEAKMAEREARHSKQGQSRYQLEPNIKENKGGLRDLHTLSWIARAVFGDGQIQTLLAVGVFSKAQAAAYERAEAFLIRVRLHLHYLWNRAEERLSFDAQIELAGAMGFTGPDTRSAVEAFMQAYFRAAKDVGDLTGIMIATIEEEFEEKPWFQVSAWRRAAKPQDVEGFDFISERLAISGAQHLVEHPLDFLRYFLVAHERGLTHAPSTLRLISQNLWLIDEVLRTSAEANALFLNLLTHEKNPATALRTMNETGVLAAFLPEWQSVVGLMQFNQYHHYTVDEHTLYCIEELHKLRAGEQGEVTAPVHEVMGQIADQSVLFVAMLYHDIAKGRPGKHEIEGAKLAPAIAERLGLSAAQGDQVTWLIREHLSLSSSAFHRDVDDAATLESIAAMAESVESLKMLYVLTAADVRAVGPGTWSAWKGDLLNRAYIGAGEILRSGEVSGGAEGRAGQVRRATTQFLADMESAPGAEDQAAFFNAAPDAYWLAYAPKDCAAHIALMAQAPTFTLDPVKRRKQVILTLAAPDKPGLFAQVTGAVTLSGWNVEAAKAHTFANGMALDTLVLTGPGSGFAPKAGELQALKANLNAALEGSQNLKDISSRLPRKRTRRQQVMDRPASVQFFAPSAEGGATIVEVRGPDRPALMFDLTATLQQLGLSLQSLRVTTYGERFVNVFYVTDLEGRALFEEKRLERAKIALLKAAETQAEL